MSVEDRLKHFRKMEYLSDSTSDSIHAAAVKTHEFWTFLRHYIKNGVLEGGEVTTNGRRVTFTTPIRGLINGQFVLYDSTTAFHPGISDGTRWIWIYPKPGSVYRNELRCTNKRVDDSTGMLLWSIELDDRGNIDEVIDERMVIPSPGYRERRWMGWYPTLDDLPLWGFQDGDVASVGNNIYVYEVSDAEIDSVTNSFWVPWASRKGVKRAFKYWRIDDDNVEIIADSTADTLTFIEGDNILFNVDAAADDATIKTFINTDLNMDKNRLLDVYIPDMTGTLNISGILKVSDGLKLSSFSDFRGTLADIVVFTPADILQVDGTSSIAKIDMREGRIDGTFLEIILNTDLTGALTINNKLFGRRDLILNGSFEGSNPPENWATWSDPTADATAWQITGAGTPDTGRYGREAPDETHWGYIHIIAAGNGADHIQFYQGSLLMKTGIKYVVSFFARALNARTIGVYCVRNVTPHTNMGLSATLSIDSTFTEYSHSFKATEDMTNARLAFYLGNDGNDFEVDKVRLYEIEEIDLSAHAPRHEVGGGDEISMTGLKGLLKDPQKITSIHGWPVDTAAVPTDGQVLRFVGCTCYNRCYGDTACTCDSVCNADLCDQCDAACYGYVACTCDSVCNVDACDICDASCNGYSGCSCVTTCYLVDKLSCGCHLTCYGYSACTCNSICVSDLCDQCNITCYGYIACTCDSVCNADLCDQCDAACYGYQACQSGCDVATYGAANQWVPVTP